MTSSPQASAKHLMRPWTINGRFLSQSVTGVQRYAREIVSALDHLLATANGSLGLELAVPAGVRCDIELSHIRIRHVPGAQGHLWEQFILPRHVSGGLLSLCNTGPLSVGHQIVCIHDVNTRIAPASYSRAFRATYRILIPAIAARSSAVATVSEYTREELLRFSIADRSKIRGVAPNGHEHALGWTPSQSEATRRVAGPNTIVLVGSTAPHKNAGLVLGLAPRLAAVGLRLAVVGKPDAKVFASLPELGSFGNVEWMGRLTDNELAALLKDSLCLCFPSLTEGFGLPVLEAMAIGCPVVSSDAASLPEVGGDAVLYASPHEPDAWYDQILSLHKNPALAEGLRAAGRQQAKRFSWRTSAAMYLRMMAEIESQTFGRSRPRAH